MEIILHQPDIIASTDLAGGTHTFEDVAAFEIVFGSENTVFVWDLDGNADSFKGTGLTVSGASIDRENYER